MSQAIEGGMQARITKPGFTKLSSLIPEIAKGALPSQAAPACIPQQNTKLQVAGTGANIQFCYNGCGGGHGCPVWTALRPDISPPGGIGVSMQDNTTKAVVDIDAAFDVNMTVPIQWQFCFFGFCAGWNHICDLSVNGPGTHVKGALNLDIDPPTGKLVPSVGDFAFVGLNLNTSNCGIASDLFNAVLGIVNGILPSFLGNIVIGLIKPQLSKLVQGFVPNPPGLAGVVNTAAALSSFTPPPEAKLETILIAGGYVSAKSGGLNLGVIAGMNSDRDPKTRTPDKVSEPSLCVPIRPAIDLSGVPWKLALQPMRQAYTLAPAGPFSGDPDPMDVMGNTQDIALGLSRTFLNVAGFHIYNSGTMCLAISGSVLSAFNAGALSLLVPSLGTLLEDRKAPVAITLRPQTPPVFKLGAGTKTDPLIHVGVTDLRIDFYAFIEERYARIFTLSLDLNIGLALSPTMDANMKPAIGIMLSGLEAANVVARVSNTDLLSEDPKRIAASLVSLIGVAVGQIAGNIKPFALPALMGFSLDGLSLARVQTQQDDFLAIYGTLTQSPAMMMLPVPPETVPYERDPAPIHTTARILDVAVPPADIIREAVYAGDVAGGNVPSVTLDLGASAPGAEWSYRVDGGAWHAWSTNPRPTIVDPAFHLQAHHTVEVRARTIGDWATEDQTPVKLDVTIDSLPPEISVKEEAGTLALSAWDNVSDAPMIRYSWKTPGGETTPAHVERISLDEAWAASDKGQKPLTVRAWDEAGNVSEHLVDLGGISAFHGRMTTPAAAGCGCSIGHIANDENGERLALLSLLPLLGLLLRRKFRHV